MELVKAKCTECGAVIDIDGTKKAGICSHCGMAFVVDEAVNNYVTNYQTVTNITQNITKVINGKEKDEGQDYVNRGLTFLKLKDFLKAAEVFGKAVKKSPEVAKNWFYLAYAESDGFVRASGEYATNLFAQSSKEPSLLQNFFALASEKDKQELQKEYGWDFTNINTFAYDIFKKIADENYCKGGFFIEHSLMEILKIEDENIKTKCREYLWQALKKVCTSDDLPKDIERKDIEAYARGAYFRLRNFFELDFKDKNNIINVLDNQRYVVNYLAVSPFFNDGVLKIENPEITIVEFNEVAMPTLIESAELEKLHFILTPNIRRCKVSKDASKYTGHYPQYAYSFETITVCEGASTAYSSLQLDAALFKFPVIKLAKGIKKFSFEKQNRRGNVVLICSEEGFKGEVSFVHGWKENTYYFPAILVGDKLTLPYSRGKNFSGKEEFVVENTDMEKVKELIKKYLPNVTVSKEIDPTKKKFLFF